MELQVVIVGIQMYNALDRLGTLVALFVLRHLVIYIFERRRALVVLPLAVQHAILAHGIVSRPFRIEEIAS